MCTYSSYHSVKPLAYLRIGKKYFSCFQNRVNPLLLSIEQLLAFPHWGQRTKQDCKDLTIQRDLSQWHPFHCQCQRARVLALSPNISIRWECNLGEILCRSSHTCLQYCDNDLQRRARAIMNNNPVSVSVPCDMFLYFFLLSNVKCVEDFS